MDRTRNSKYFPFFVKKYTHNYIPKGTHLKTHKNSNLLNIYTICLYYKIGTHIAHQRDRAPLSFKKLFGKEVMKKGFFIFTVSFAFVCIVFQIAAASKISNTEGSANAVNREARRYCSIEVPSAASLYRGYTKIFVTKRGYVASTVEGLLDKAIELSMTGNSDAFLSFISEHQSVFFLKGNLMAEIEKESWPGKVRIRLIDFNLSIWTVIEAVE
jgi:hypothetical protein